MQRRGQWRSHQPQSSHENDYYYDHHLIQLRFLERIGIANKQLNGGEMEKTFRPRIQETPIRPPFRPTFAVFSTWPGYYNI